MQKEYLQTARDCLAFIQENVSSFHVIANMEKRLQAAGFTELVEKEDWSLAPGGSYYVKRNDSSAIAFRIPEKKSKGFHIMASHSDSPCFKLKAKAENQVEGHYGRLNVEPYGGMILASWLDRCLSIAGRVVYQDEEGLKTRLVNIDEDLLVIPNVAIHMNRDMNQGLTYNPQVDLQPLFFVSSPRKEETPSEVLKEKLADWTHLPAEKILGQDLFLYVREQSRLAGAGEELMISPRLDDQQCVYGTLTAMLANHPREYITLCAVFDNEEVGSLTRQGAASTFLTDVMSRIKEALALGNSEYLRLLADSFVISADNAHAVHPNHPEKADPTCRPYLNQGIVIKHHGGQKYTTDAYSEAFLKSLCREAASPWQEYCNRSDIPGGSTLGNLLNLQISMPCVDIGLPQLAMHSAMETAGSQDVYALIQMAGVFYRM